MLLAEGLGIVAFQQGHLGRPTGPPSFGQPLVAAHILHRRSVEEVLDRGLEFVLGDRQLHPGFFGPGQNLLVKQALLRFGQDLILGLVEDVLIQRSVFRLHLAIGLGVHQPLQMRLRLHPCRLAALPQRDYSVNQCRGVSVAEEIGKVFGVDSIGRDEVLWQQGSLVGGQCVGRELYLALAQHLVEFYIRPGKDFFPYLWPEFGTVGFPFGGLAFGLIGEGSLRGSFGVFCGPFVDKLRIPLVLVNGHADGRGLIEQVAFLDRLQIKLELLGGLRLLANNCFLHALK